jgi:hypothetical protein
MGGGVGNAEAQGDAAQEGQVGLGTPAAAK